MFDVTKLLSDVFDPQPGELATVVVDLPTDEVPDTAEWQERRSMAERWREALVALAAERGFTVNPMLSYPATGANNADLPAAGQSAGAGVELQRALLDSTLVIAMTEFSATAPLSVMAEEKEDFRAASMPGVLSRMEESALAADYGVVARRCKVIEEAMLEAELCDVLFSTGHRCWFDLRFGRPEADDGFLPRFKPGDRIINLPSGETFQVPYEGQREGEPSWTAGTIPVGEDDGTVLFQVAGNRVVRLGGAAAGARRWQEYFDADPARANIAEVAFGVNEKAVVTGNVLEDEKAGFHWAFGRSDHLGGITGVAAFRSPKTVVHWDIVYAVGNPIQVARATLVGAGGERTDIIRDGTYLV